MRVWRGAPERSPRRFSFSLAVPRLPSPHPQPSSHGMERKPPKKPRVAWAKSEAPQERKPPSEFYQVTEVQSLNAGE